MTVPPGLWFPRPLNPDYYARIGGACFDVVWQPLASYSKDQFKQFILAVMWAHRKGPSDEGALQTGNNNTGNNNNNNKNSLTKKKFY